MVAERSSSSSSSSSSSYTSDRDVGGLWWTLVDSGGLEIETFVFEMRVPQMSPPKSTSIRGVCALTRSLYQGRAYIPIVYTLGVGATSESTQFPA